MRIGIFTLLIGCTSNSTVDKISNKLPVISIVSHQDGRTFLEGQENQFRAQASDDDHPTEELQVAWYIGEDIACDWSLPEADGSSFCDLRLELGDEQIVAEVRDADGGGGSDAIDILVDPTEAPEIVLISPESLGLYYSDSLIEFSALVSDLEDSVSDLSIQWTSSLDGLLDFVPSPDTSGEIQNYDYLTEGEHAIELRVEDSSMKVTTESIVIQVGGENHSPECGIVEPFEGAVTLYGDTIVFRAQTMDEDIDPEELLFSWVSDKDGELGQGFIDSDGMVTFSTNTLSANTHIIQFRVEDEMGESCQDTISLTVGSSPTVVIDSPSDGAIFQIGESVTFVATVSDTEEQSSTLRIEWSSDLDGILSTTAASSQGISQFSSQSLLPGAHQIVLFVTDSDGLSSQSSIELQINSPPTQPTVSISPNPATSSDDLTAVVSTSVDSDGDPISYSYQWLREGALTSHITSMVPASETSGGEVWMVQVTPSDGMVNGDMGEYSLVIENTSPVISAVSISPNPAYTGDTLTCIAAASDPDDGTLSPSYSWEIGGLVVGSASTFILDQNVTNVGDSLFCIATAVDSDGESASNSSFVVVSNTAPIVSGITLSPIPAYNSSLMTCSATVTDPDEALVLSYDWFLNGAPIGIGDTINLNPTSVVPTDIISCQASATDSSLASDSQMDSLNLTNRAPSSPLVQITPSSPLSSEDLFCSASGSVDPDGQLVSYSYSWLSSNNISQLGQSLSASMTSEGEIWTCTAVPSDGTLSGNAESIDVQIEISWDGDLVFNSCGVTGRTGPSSSDCINSYFGTNLEGAVSVLSGIQYWTVPSTGTYSIEVWGAEGSRGKDYNTTYYATGVPGKGAYLYGEFWLFQGEVIKILVGQRALDDVQWQQKGGGGGGGTFVSQSDDTPLIVAGGGGGSGRYNGMNGGDGQITTSGSAGTAGAAGGSNGDGGNVISCGYGGNSGAGYYGNGLSDCGNSYISYAFVNGGAGSEYSHCWVNGHEGGFGGGAGSGPHGGSGGGGYSGGGGGGDHNCFSSGGGGGGGSYNDGLNPSSSSGVQSGDGEVLISFQN